VIAPVGPEGPSWISRWKWLVPALALVAYGALASPASAGMSFTSPTFVDSGSNEIGLELGDFNEDGNPDVITANTSPAASDLRLGRPGGGWFDGAAGWPKSVSGQATDLVTGDFNKDGHLDAAVVSLSTNLVNVLLGDGTGGILSNLTYSTGSSPFDIATGDFNDDGNPDLVTANQNGNNVTVLLGNGTGAFSASGNYAVGAVPRGVSVGDVTGDGEEDLVVANLNANTVSVLVGNGDGTFNTPGATYATTNGPRKVALGDFNEDGSLDIATADSGDGVPFNPANKNDKTTVLLNNGSGSFSAASGSPFTTGAAQSSPFAIRAVDMNGDGHLDLVTANRFGGSFSVLLGNGHGGFAAPVALTSPDLDGTAITDVVVGDTNHDGSPDVIGNMPQSGTGFLVLFQNTTTIGAPTITDSDPDSPSNDNNPKIKGSAEDGATVSLYTTSDCSGSAVASGPASTFASPGISVSVPSDTTTTLYAQATNHAGWATSGCSSGFDYTEDSTAPATPSIDSSAPASPANDNNPKLIGTADASTLVKLYASSDCSGLPEAAGTPGDFASPGLTVSVANDSSTTFKATATDSAGNESACSSGFTYTEDSTPPAIPSIDSSSPASPADNNNPKLIGTAVSGSTVKLYTSSDCSGSPVATGTAATFASPGITVGVPDDSSTTFKATATDPVGNESACSSGFTYVEDSTAPDAPTNLGTDPGSPGRDASPRITGTAEPGSTVKLYTTPDCSGAPDTTGSAAQFGGNGITVSLPSGATRDFRATATDSAGHTSSCSDPVSYTQDNTGTSAYYVRQSGTGSACTQTNPCASIATALATHRLAPTTDDVIDVGPGTFVGNVDASSTADAGLTIRGTLDPDRLRETTIRSDADGLNDCANSPCAVLLGLSPGVPVVLQDLNVDTVGGDDSITPVEANGGSDLTYVHLAAHPNAFPNQILALGDDPGTVIDSSTIDAGGDFSSGIATQNAGFDITDSHVIGGCGCEAIEQDGSAGGPITVTRTWLESDPNGGGTGVYSQGDLTVDSSLITGGDFGVDFEGSNGGTVQIQNSTIDLETPGSYDCCDSVHIQGDGSHPVDTTIANSILAEDLESFSGGGGPGSVNCTHSDLHLVSVQPPFTDNCAIGNNGNTSTDPSNQFVGGSPFSWQLKSDAPAVDTGDPNGIDPSFSQTDLAGNPRVAAGTSAGCPDGIVDMGAYERLEVPCGTNGPSITNPHSPTLNTKLRSTTGQWAGSPTGYEAQWLRCDAGGDNCNPASPYRSTGTYIPVSADVGHTLRVRYLATYAQGDRGPATSDPTDVVTTTAPTNVTLPSITGGSNPAVGMKLGSSPGAWSNDPTSYQSQWLRCDADGTNCSAITSYSDYGKYITVGADLGHTLRIRYIATNSAGDSAPATSNPSGVVSGQVPVNVRLPSLSNGASPQVGTKLGSIPGGWTNAPSSYQSQWLRCDSGGANCSAITSYSANGKYTTVGADLGHTLRVRYIATNAGGDSAPATSDPSGVVTQPAPTNLTLPSITNGGSPQVGMKLGSSPGAWTGNPTSYQSQWLRCDSGGGNCSAIDSYSDYGKHIVVSADVGHTLKVRYIATNPGGDSSPATSNPSGVVH
jgi:FG-GAP-like repeat